MLLQLGYPRFLLLLAVAFAAQRTHGFTFEMEPKIPTQCGSVTFTWVGGEPPFHLLIIPPLNPLIKVDIPASHWNGLRGEYKHEPLTFARDKPIMFAMGDATGYTAGGMTDILKVNVPRPGDGECDETFGTGRPNFTFELESPLVECTPFPFTGIQPFTAGGSPRLTHPVTILGFIPSANESFQQVTTTRVDESRFDWVNNQVARDTEVVFHVRGANGENGGTSAEKTSIAFQNGDCIKQKPSNGATAPPNKKTDIGMIVGGVVGGLAVLAIIIAAVVFYRKRKTARTQGVSVLLEEMKFGAVNDGSGDSATARLLPAGSAYSEDHGSSPSHYGPTSYTPTSYAPSSHAGSSSSSSHAPPYNPQPNVFTKDRAGPGTSAAPQRVIVHQDIDEATEEPMELPPQYSESRNPIPGLPSSFALTSAGGSSSNASGSRPPLRDQKIRS